MKLPLKTHQLHHLLLAHFSSQLPEKISGLLAQVLGLLTHGGGAVSPTPSLSSNSPTNASKKLARFLRQTGKKSFGKSR